MTQLSTLREVRGNTSAVVGGVVCRTSVSSLFWRSFFPESIARLVAFPRNDASFDVAPTLDTKLMGMQGCQPSYALSNSRGILNPTYSHLWHNPLIVISFFSVGDHCLSRIERDWQEKQPSMGMDEGSSPVRISSTRGVIVFISLPIATSKLQEACHFKFFNPKQIDIHNVQYPC